MSAGSVVTAPLPVSRARADRWPASTPLALLLLLAIVLRFGTLDHQSLWYDEAVTALRVLHSSLGATLSAVVHVENTPPFYYIVTWAWTQVFGGGAFALRSVSALAGVGTVWVCWTIGLELGSRRVAILLAAIVATNPLFVWYSQEARAYELFVLLAAIAFLYFLRARRDPTAVNLTGWALSSALALATHYFAAFLIAIEGLLLLWRWRRSRPVQLALAGVCVATGAIAPLAISQGGRGTSWIANWSLSGRAEATGQYYLLGKSGQPLGHLVTAATLVPIVAALVLAPRLGGQRRGAFLLCLGVGVFAVVAPLLLALAGWDYLTPRYLAAVWVPLSAALALLLAAGATRIGVALAVLVCLANVSVDAAVYERSQLQRGDWRGAALALRGGPAERAIVLEVEGALPLQYYTPRLKQTSASTVTVREIDLIGYPPLRERVARSPAPGFTLAARHSISGIDILRFRATHPTEVAVSSLLRARPRAVASVVLAAVGGPA